MGANLSFERPKCRYPDPLNKKNQVGPKIVKDPYLNKRGPLGLNINVSNPSSLMGPMLQSNSSMASMLSPQSLQSGLQSSSLGSMLSPQGLQSGLQSSPLGSMLSPQGLQSGLQSSPFGSMLSSQGVQSNPQLSGFLSGLSKKSPKELENLSRSLGSGMDPKQLSGLMSIASPYLSKLTPAQNNGISKGLEESTRPPIPSTPPPPLPSEGGSKEKSVKELRKICKRNKIQITKDGKYLTKKELLKIMKRKKL